MVSANEANNPTSTRIKIAAVSNDGVMIAGHFGMAENYQVVTVEAGKIISQESRPKPHHTLHPDLEASQAHDHQDMFSPIRDCRILLCGGMRTRAYDHATAAGLQVIMTVGRIEDAVKAYLNGTLISDTRRIRTG